MPRSPLSKALLVALTATVLAIAALAEDRTQLPLLVTSALIAGGLLVWLWRRNDCRMTGVVLFAVGFRLVLLFLPPSLSDDSYRYVWDGLVQVQGVNPYQCQPEDPILADLHDEPVYDLLNSQSYYTVYPPASQLIFAFGALFYDGGWMSSYYAIKLILVLSEILAVLLLARMVEPRWLMLYAWNPLVLLETAGQAHTESLLLLLLVVVVYAARAGWGGRASVVLAVAGWVKLYPFVLFPFLWRRFGWRAVWPGAMVAIGLATPYAATFVPGNVWASLDLYARLFEFNAGLYYGIKEVFLFFTGADWSKQIGPALRLAFLVGLPVVYVLDGRFKWPLARAFLVTIGLYLLLATTVHPWYLLSLLLLATLLGKAAWHWYWLGLFSIGTYLLYVGGPYWEFVALGWGGWFLLAARRYGPRMFQGLMRYRAWRKFRFIQPYLPRLKRPIAVLDLGAGEGYVGERIQSEMQATVMLTDVVDFNRTGLRHVTYNGKELPWRDDEYDVVVLYFVLHHADDQQQLMREALRVSSDRVIVVESVFEKEGGRRLLTTLDKLANRIRSGGLMNKREAGLTFRTVDEWRTIFRDMHVDVLVDRRRGRWLHRQVLFVLSARSHA